MERNRRRLLNMELKGEESSSSEEENSDDDHDHTEQDLQSPSLMRDAIQSTLNNFMQNPSIFDSNTNHNHNSSNHNHNPFEFRDQSETMNGGGIQLSRRNSLCAPPRIEELGAVDINNNIPELPQQRRLMTEPTDHVIEQTSSADATVEDEQYETAVAAFSNHRRAQSNQSQIRSTSFRSNHASSQISNSRKRRRSPSPTSQRKRARTSGSSPNLKQNDRRKSNPLKRRHSLRLQGTQLSHLLATDSETDSKTLLWKIEKMRYYPTDKMGEFYKVMCLKESRLMESKLNDPKLWGGLVTDLHRNHHKLFGYVVKAIGEQMTPPKGQGVGGILNHTIALFIFESPDSLFGGNCVELTIVADVKHKHVVRKALGDQIVCLFRREYPNKIINMYVDSKRNKELKRMIKRIGFKKTTTRKSVSHSNTMLKGYTLGGKIVR